METLRETASQTSTQVKQVVDTVAALATVTSQTKVSLDELTSAVQKLANVFAGRHARPQGSKDRKCYHCDRAGHITGAQDDQRNAGWEPGRPRVQGPVRINGCVRQLLVTWC